MEDIALFQTLYHALPVGVIVYNQKAEILSMNPLGQKILDLHPPWPPLLSLFPLPLDKLFELSPHPHCWKEAEIRCLEKSSVFVSYQFSSFRTGDGGLTHTLGLCLFHDTTEQVKERQKREKRVQITSVAHLLPSIAHEFKNPLAGIRSMIEVLLEETHQKEHQEDLMLVLEEIERMRLLVDRMRLIEEAQTTLPPARIDLALEVERVVQLCARRAKHQGISLAAQGEKPFYASLDQEMFFLTLLNLVTNAMDACSRDDAVEIDFERRGPSIFVTVSDTGRGMSPEILQRIAEPFFSTKRGGSGIGLALARDVVERWGGQLTLRSQEGSGTQVLLSLPERSF